MAFFINLKYKLDFIWSVTTYVMLAIYTSVLGLCVMGSIDYFQPFRSPNKMYSNFYWNILYF